MTNKERVHASLEGRPVDRCPVTSLYNQLSRLDHFQELTGLPACAAAMEANSESGPRRPGTI